MLERLLVRRAAQCGGIFLLITACADSATTNRGTGASDDPPSGADADVIIGVRDGGGVDAPGVCRNLQCLQLSCPGDGTTTLRGTVYAPNGTLPLYNALVYVPNAELPPIPPGLSCDRCDAVPAGEPVVAALTDHRGEFVLEDVPAGQDIPLVFQVGKWRRQITVPEVRGCEDNVLDDPDQTRLPRNRSEGDMPRIALTTGACDNLVCLIAKLGIDPEEWGIAGEDRAVTFFAGNLDPPPETLDPYEPRLRAMTPASTLWGDWNELQKYDMAVLSCECSEVIENKGPEAYEAVTRYLRSGGRIFGTDYQYVWYENSTDAAIRDAVDIKGDAPEGTNPVLLDTSFPKGKALADWLSVLRPTEPYGEVNCSNVFDNFDGASQPQTRIWGSSAQATGDVHPRFVTMNVPVDVPVEQQCGRAAHLDAHITSIFTRPIVDFPADCGAELENGEQVLAFFFFDVAACIQDDNVEREPPPIIR